MSTALVRYSDEELTEFQALVEGKLVEARLQLNLLQEQILDIAENNGDEHGGDWMDDSSTNNDVEMLNNMAIRQRKYIQDLENALIRISNKTYGICSLTGNLIDKRRLMAVPTTTKSVAAKQEERIKEEEKIVVHPSKTPYVKGEGAPGRLRSARPTNTRRPANTGNGTATFDLDDEDEPLSGLNADADFNTLERDVDGPTFVD